jgi:hypothetical protein
MQQLTKDDIHHYNVDKLMLNRHFADMSTRHADLTTQLINSITEKASGVFLWVYLVVQSLLHGISNGNSISDL